MMYGYIYPRQPGHKIVVHTFPTDDRREWISSRTQRTALCGHWVQYGWTWRWHLKVDKPIPTIGPPYEVKGCVRCDRMRIVMDMAS
jgi:hypothetical protein